LNPRKKFSDSELYKREGERERKLSFFSPAISRKNCECDRGERSAGVPMKGRSIMRRISGDN